MIIIFESEEEIKVLNIEEIKRLWQAGKIKLQQPSLQVDVSPRDPLERTIYEVQKLYQKSEQK